MEGREEVAALPLHMDYIALADLQRLGERQLLRAAASLGLAVIFGVLRVVNFAPCALYMLGAFAAYLLLQDFGVGFWAPRSCSRPLRDRRCRHGPGAFAIRRLYGLDPLYNFTLTFGLTLMIQDGVRLRYGLQGQPYPAPG